MARPAFSSVTYSLSDIEQVCLSSLASTAKKKIAVIAVRINWMDEALRTMSGTPVAQIFKVLNDVFLQFHSHNLYYAFKRFLVLREMCQILFFFKYFVSKQT